MKRGLDTVDVVAPPAAKRHRDDLMDVIVCGVKMRARPDNFGMITAGCRFKRNTDQDTVVKVDFPFEFPHCTMVLHVLESILRMTTPLEINHYLKSMPPIIRTIVMRCMDYMSAVAKIEVHMTSDRWSCLWFGGRDAIKRHYQDVELMDLHDVECMDASLLPCSMSTAMDRLERWISVDFLRQFYECNSSPTNVVFAGGFVLSAFFMEENPGDIDIFVGSHDVFRLVPGSTDIVLTESTVRFTYKDQRYNVILVDKPTSSIHKFDFDCVRAEYSPMMRTVYASEQFLNCVEECTIMEYDCGILIPNMSSYNRIRKYMARGFDPPNHWIYPAEVRQSTNSIVSIHPSYALYDGDLTKLVPLKVKKTMSYTLQAESIDHLGIPHPECPSYTYKQGPEETWIECTGSRHGDDSSNEYTLRHPCPLIYRRGVVVEVKGRRYFSINGTPYHVINACTLACDQVYNMDVLFVEVFTHENRPVRWVSAYRVL